MKMKWSLKAIPRVQYELKEEYEDKYIGYLKKRYGVKRANTFVHAG